MMDGRDEYDDYSANLDRIFFALLGAIYTAAFAGIVTAFWMMQDLVK